MWCMNLRTQVMAEMGGRCPRMWQTGNWKLKGNGGVVEPQRVHLRRKGPYWHPKVSILASSCRSFCGGSRLHSGDGQVAGGGTPSPGAWEKGSSAWGTQGRSALRCHLCLYEQQGHPEPQLPYHLHLLSPCECWWDRLWVWNEPRSWAQPYCLAQSWGFRRLPHGCIIPQESPLQASFG